MVPFSNVHPFLLFPLPPLPLFLPSLSSSPPPLSPPSSLPPPPASLSISLQPAPPVASFWTLYKKLMISRTNWRYSAYECLALNGMAPPPLRTPLPHLPHLVMGGAASWVQNPTGEHLLMESLQVTQMAESATAE